MRAFVCVFRCTGKRVYPCLPSIPRAGALLSAAFLAPPYFSTLLHKRHDFRKKKVTEYEMCVLILFTTFNISHYTKKSERYCNKISKRLRVKYPLFFSGFN
jgi:hypothetical protein